MRPRDLAWLVRQLRPLPWRVKLFQLRAWSVALRQRDRQAFIAAVPPGQIADLLRIANGRTNIVELGTGNGWSLGALAVAHPHRRVVSYDPLVCPDRAKYLRQLPRAARERVELREVPGASGPRELDPPVEMLFIDSSHEHEETVESFTAWLPFLTENAIVAFDDYTNPGYPGVASAVAELGLKGKVVNGIFVWAKPPPLSA